MSEHPLHELLPRALARACGLCSPPGAAPGRRAGGALDPGNKVVVMPRGEAYVVAHGGGAAEPPGAPCGPDRGGLSSLIGASGLPRTLAYPSLSAARRRPHIPKVGPTHGTAQTDL